MAASRSGKFDEFAGQRIRLLGRLSVDSQPTIVKCCPAMSSITPHGAVHRMMWLNVWNVSNIQKTYKSASPCNRQFEVQTFDRKLKPVERSALTWKRTVVIEKSSAGFSFRVYKVNQFCLRAVMRLCILLNLNFWYPEKKKGQASKSDQHNGNRICARRSLTRGHSENPILFKRCYFQTFQAFPQRNWWLSKAVTSK